MGIGLGGLQRYDADERRICDLLGADPLQAACPGTARRRLPSGEMVFYFDSCAAAPCALHSADAGKRSPGIKSVAVFRFQSWHNKREGSPPFFAFPFGVRQ